MPNKPKQPSFRCLLIIVDSTIRDSVSEFLKDSGISIFYQMHGVGTASSEFLNLCGLGDTHKSITLCFVQKHFTRLVLAEMNQALKLHKKGTGIAVSIPLSGLQGWLYKLLDSQLTDVERKEIESESEKEVNDMSETITHALILIALNQGFSDDVMYTARAAGATGGTILKGLCCGSMESAKLFGIAIQEEQEIIAIVVPQEKRTEIMTAITSQHGPSTPAHGVAISLPVDAVMGI